MCNSRECPNCGYVFIKCFYCNNDAEYEGWVGSEHIIKVNVCEDHAPKLRGYDEYIKEQGVKT